MADNQPPNNQAIRKLPIPPSPTTTYMTKTSTQKKTNQGKQAKKKELGRASLRVEALEERDGEGPGSCTHSSFQAKSTLFSILPTSALSYLCMNFEMTCLQMSLHTVHKVSCFP